MLKIFLFILSGIVSFSATAEPTLTRAEILREDDEDQVVRGYKPIYFAYGEPSTKIQFSFRSQLLEEFPLNFGYTQVIFWNLREESKPFNDATYNPEFFYRWTPFRGKWLAVDFGIWDHNSNGKAEQESRSYNQSYIRASYLKDWGELSTLFSVKLKYMYNLDSTNRNIRDFIGPLDYDLRFIHIFKTFLDKGELIFSACPGGPMGTDLDKGGYQIAVNFHLKGFVVKVNPAFYVQYYHGYAETLLNYEEKVDEFRIGLMF